MKCPWQNIQAQHTSAWSCSMIMEVYSQTRPMNRDLNNLYGGLSLKVHVTDPNDPPLGYCVHNMILAPYRLRVYITLRWHGGVLLFHSH